MRALQGYIGITAVYIRNRNSAITSTFQFRLESGRNEVVYNIEEEPFRAALRYGKYKLLWGKTKKVYTYQ